MGVAREGEGVRADLDALASQVHPVFMLPPIAVSWYGALLAGAVDFVIGSVHMLAIFAAVYTAHVKDGYVDCYIRGEDATNPLTPAGCYRALVGASALFGACLVTLYVLVDIWAVLLTAPCWFIAYHHAPHLDLTPIGSTAGYPAGIALSLLGGHYGQAIGLSGPVVASAIVLFVLVSGIKIIDDSKDFRYDRSIEKRTVAVLVGPARARSVAYGLFGLACLLTVGAALGPLFPIEAAGAAFAFGVVAAIAHSASSKRATMLLIRGAYVFVAVLLAAIWFAPSRGL